MSAPKHTPGGLNRYEVMLPYHQYLHYTVDAESPEEAVRLVEGGFDRDGNQIHEDCSTGCGQTAKTKVRLISKAEGRAAISRAQAPKPVGKGSP